MSTTKRGGRAASRPPAPPNVRRSTPRGVAPVAYPPAPPGRRPLAVVVAGSAEPSEHLFRRLLGAYLAGAPEFLVRQRPAITPATREVVRAICRRTRQPEIVWEEEEAIRLQDLAYDGPVSLAQRVQRMGRLVLEMHRDAVDSWSHLPLGDEEYWERRDDEADREAWYIQRLSALRWGSGDDAAGLVGAWTVARSLERIADHAVVLGVTGQRLAVLPHGSDPTTSLRQFHRQAMEHLEGALGAGDGEAANELLDTGEALAAAGRSLADRLLPGVGRNPMPPATAAAVATLLDSVRRTIAYAQDIAQVALDRSVPIVTVPGGPRSLIAESLAPSDGVPIP